jgi:putative ABC transport system permease protein
MQLKDTLSLAFRTIQANRLRTGITVSIIGFGIMALIGIITAIASMNQSVSESFATMGANSFSIRYNDIRINRGRNEVKKTSTSALKSKTSNERKLITYREAKLFKERYSFPARVSISIGGPNSVVVNNETTKTNPNISILGADENYLIQSGYTLLAGRNFNKIDVESGRSICILGYSVAKNLYGENTQRAIDKIIKVA